MYYFILLLALGQNHTKYEIDSGGVVRYYDAFVSAFDSEDDNNGDGVADRLGVPIWVSYELKRYNGELPSGGNRPSWFWDEELEEKGLSPTDSSYKGSGYSRGHLCMRSHARRTSASADYQTHTLSNCVPQLQKGNAGAWLHLENLTAEWADQFGSVWIVCGPVFMDNEYKWIGDEGEFPVAVPDALFKVVIRPDGEVLSFLIPQEGVGNFGSPVSSKVEPFLTSVQVIEALTGIEIKEIPRFQKVTIADRIW